MGVTTLRDKLRNLSPERRKLLERLLEKDGVDLGDRLEIPRRSDRSRAPASYAQERLWFLDRLDPGSAAYAMPTASRLAGALDLCALVRAFAGVTRRHEVLRTTFDARDGVPEQVVHPPGSLPVPVADLSALPERRRLAEAVARTRREAARPFDLERGPLFRLLVFRLAPDDHVVLANLHHAVADGWSLAVMMREVDALYGAATGGSTGSLPEPKIQYGDYAAWQRDRLAGPPLERGLAFWRERLAGVPEVLDLPVDRPRSPDIGSHGATVSFRLDEATAERLRALARRAGATLHMALSAAFQIHLYRICGQSAAPVAWPVAGRSREELEELIGLFVNTLVLHAPISGDRSFADHLAAVRRIALDAHEHQEVPFERVVEEIDPERSLSHAPLAQVALSMETGAGASASAGGAPVPEGARFGNGLELRPFDFAAAGAKFDLALTFSELDGGLAGLLEYRSDLFDGTTARRLTRSFRTLLHAALAAPDRPVDSLRLLLPVERHQALVEWGSGPVPVGVGRTVHGAFAERARECPDAVAVQTTALAPGGPEHLTYGALLARSRKLARRLAETLGPDPTAGRRIGLCSPRDLDLPVAILALLELGAVWVQLDLAYPSARLAGMVEAAGVDRILTRKELEPELDGLSVPRIDLETERAASEVYDEGHGPVLPAVSRDALAYIMFTSGSTGRPKPVAVPHAAAAWYGWNASRRFGMLAGDRLLQFSALSFDIFVEELLGSFSAGGTLVLRDAAAGSPREFLQRCVAERVSYVCLPTAFWHELVPLLEAGAELAGSFRGFVVGGERMLPERVRSWRRHVPGVRLFNSYGPTETTVVATVHDVPVEDEAADSVPIGRPIPGAAVRVVDRRLRAVPVGTVGELLLGGEGVGGGYPGRPAETARLFVPDPWPSRAGDRVYRTGDRVRWRRDGVLEFLGRTDRQLKVRGYRIEPAEIEAVLEARAEVAQAWVVGWSPEGGDTADAPAEALAAYVVPAGAEEPDAGTLRSWIAERLPAYMVPAALVLVDAFPTTPAGKLDPKALPDPAEHALPTAAHEPPRGPVEEVLAGIWSDLLGRRRIDRGDGFFALGGHSLLATRLSARVEEAFLVELPLRVLFEAPVFRDLAARIDELRSRGLPAPPPIRPVARDRPLPLSFAQRRLWFVHRLDPESGLYNIPSGLRFREPFDAPAFAAALTTLAARHEPLRTRFEAEDGEPFQVVAAPAAIRLPVVDLRGLVPDRREREARRIAGEEAECPFDLAEEPLFRAAAVRLDREDHLVLLTFHHAVADGWSTGVLARDMTELYGAAREGRAPRLPELPIQYADFAVWQREWLRGEVLESLLSFWRRRLSGAPSRLDLPPAAGDDAAVGTGWLHPVALGPDVSGSLADLARRERATLFMVVLAIVQAALHHSTGAVDLVVGTDAANRRRPEVADLVGFFVNHLVLRTDLSGNPTFRELLTRSRETVLEAYAHEDLPFDLLVSELRPESRTGEDPLFDFLLLVEDEGEEEADETGDDATDLTPGSGGVAVRRDLTLGLRRTGAGLHGAWTYRSTRFDPGGIRRLGERFERIAACVAEAPETRLSDLGEPVDAERRRMEREDRSRLRSGRAGRARHPVRRVTAPPAEPGEPSGEDTDSW